MADIAPSARDLELAALALKFFLAWDTEKERLTNVGLLFALARSEGATAGFKELKDTPFFKSLPA